MAALGRLSCQRTPTADVIEGDTSAQEVRGIPLGCRPYVHASMDSLCLSAPERSSRQSVFRHFRVLRHSLLCGLSGPWTLAGFKGSRPCPCPRHRSGRAVPANVGAASRTPCPRDSSGRSSSPAARSRGPEPPNHWCTRPRRPRRLTVVCGRRWPCARNVGRGSLNAFAERATIAAAMAGNRPGKLRTAPEILRRTNRTRRCNETVTKVAQSVPS